MGRPRKGVVSLPDGRWTAGLPIAVGSKKTRQFTDADETAVRRWYADAERALAAGRPLPDPAGYRPGRPAPTLAALALGERTPASWWAGPTAAHGHLIDKVAAAFVEHHYDRQRSGQPERRRAVVATIANDLLPFFAQHRVTVVERITHELAGKLAAHLAGLEVADTQPEPEPWPDLDGRTEVTLTEAAALHGTSRSTVKRWQQADLLPSWHRDDLDGQVRIRVDELRAAYRSGRAAAAKRTINKATTAGNKLDVLKMILNFARANGIDLTGTPMLGISAVHPEGTDPVRRKNPHVPLELFGRVAAHLPVVHQLTMWLERLLGVRISEGFGPHVGDVLDFGPVLGGAIVLGRQGGRPFLIRADGHVVAADEKEGMKNDTSHRAIRLPRQLMGMVRVVIEAFHTDPVTGEVDLEARLIPGLRTEGRSGQQAHRAALSKAVTEAGMDTELYGKITPHELRAYLITDLDRAGVDATLARRYVGHAAGNDVHATAYLRDPARAEEDLRAWLPVTEALERLIDEQLGGTLLVPTAMRETFGTDNPLHARRRYVYTTLAAHGWYLEPSTDAGQALLSTEEVARVLGIGVTTARRQLRDGTIPGGRPVQKGRRVVWMCPAEDVEAHRGWLADYPTIETFAADLGMTYHQCYALMRELNITGLQKVKGGDIRLTPHDIAVLRAEQARRQDMAARAVPLNVAAAELDVPLLVIEDLLRQGLLEEAHELGRTRQRLVTRTSVEQYARRRAGATAASPGEPVVSHADARAITGLTRPGLARLLTAGVLTPAIRNRRQCVTVASLRRWAEEAGRVDVLHRLAQRRVA